MNNEYLFWSGLTGAKLEFKSGTLLSGKSNGLIAFDFLTII